MKRILCRFTFVLLFLIVTAPLHCSYAEDTLPQELLSDGLPEELKSDIFEKLLPPVTQELIDHIKHLKTQKKRTFKTLKGRNFGKVCSVRFKPNGEPLFSSSMYKCIEIWNPNQIYQVRSLYHQEEYVNSTCFSPDGKLLAAASQDNTLKIWNIDTKDLLHYLTGHQEGVNDVCFSPDGKLLASASQDNTVKVWNTDTGALLHSFTEHEAPVYSVCFSPDGKLLASGSYDRTVKLWNTDTGALSHSLTGHRDRVNSVRFSPNTNQLASVSNDGTIKIWNTDTGALSRSLYHQGWVDFVCFSPNGKMLASASSYGSIKLWNPDTGAFAHTLPNGNNKIDLICFRPNGNLLAATNGTIKTWNLYDQEDEEALELFNNPDGMNSNQKMLLYILYVNQEAAKHELKTQRTQEEKALDAKYYGNKTSQLYQYMKSKEALKQKYNIRPSVNLREIEQALQATYQGQNEPIPAILNLKQSYDSLCEPLKKVVKDYFRVIE